MRHTVGILIVLLLSAGHDSALGQGSGTTTNWDAPSRSKATCAKIRQELEETSKRFKLDTKIKPGWSKVRAELRKLPPDAELCGVDSELGQAIIKSPLYGKALEAYYAPLFAKIGCKPMTCEIFESKPFRQTRCKCSMPGGVGAVTTNVSDESFSLGTL